MDRKFRKHLSVEADIRLDQFTHECRVREPLLFCRNTNTGRPEGSEIALLELAMARGISHPPLDGLSGVSDKRRFGTSKSLGTLEYFVSSPAGFKTAFCTWHDYLLNRYLSIVRKQSLDGLDIGIMDQGVPAKIAFSGL